MILKKLRTGLRTGCCLVSLLLILVVNTNISLGASNTGIVTVTIIPNTLDISIKAPEKVIGNSCFTVEVMIRNLGEEEIQSVTAIIYIDEENLQLINEQAERNFGTIAPYREKSRRWLIKPTKSSTYIIIVFVKGMSNNIELSSSDSAIIEVDL